MNQINSEKILTPWPRSTTLFLHAIARMNRPHEDDGSLSISCVFILDFAGIFEKPEKALAFKPTNISMKAISYHHPGYNYNALIFE
jgi:hypothetical protein